jgi:anti-sigma regulatory factor (Ser/Thr protein kinase)
VVDRKHRHRPASEHPTHEAGGRAALPWSRLFPTEAKQIERARNATRAALMGWPFSAETAELLVSELVTNATLHSGGRRYSLEIGRPSKGRVRISVIDQGRSGKKPEVRAPTDLDERGRGLWLVSQLSADWGVARVASRGLAVWFELAEDEETQSQALAGVSPAVPTTLVAGDDQQ